MNINNIDLILSFSSIPDLLARDRPETFGTMNALHFAATFFSFISLLFLLAALGSDYWIVDSSKHLGLWKYCDDGTCYSLGVKSVSGFCVMIAMSIFSGTFGSTNQYGWSFGLGWASFPLYILT
ncbi:hypothetical protein Chor_005337, partial [Crotalus horridus]